MSAVDAVGLRSTAPVVGVTYRVNGAGGGVNFDRTTPPAEVAKSLARATQPYGFTPAITGVSVAETSAPTTANTRSRAVAEDVAAKIRSAAAALPSTQTQGTPKQPKLGLPDSKPASSPQARAAAEGDNAPFKPDNANNTAWEFDGGVATIRHDLVWTGSTQYPWTIGGDFGLEIGDKQVNRSITDSTRPVCESRAETDFWAVRADSNHHDPLSWTTIIADNNAGDYYPYWDWENDLDTCQEMDLTVGIGKPSRLHKSNGKSEFHIFTEVKTTRGNLASNGSNSNMQTPSNDCTGFDPASWCMGLNTGRSQGAVTLLREGTGKPLPGSWHWTGSDGIAQWEFAKCVSYGAIGTAYQRVRNSVGACSTWEYSGPNGGRQQEYANGRIFYHPNTGAFGVWGSIAQTYANLFEAGGPLRYPTSDEVACPRKSCKFNRFETGNIYWSASTGAHEVYGAIFQEYGRQGYENGRFGLPTTGEFITSDGRQVNFQGGWIKYVTATGRIVTS